MNKGFHAAKEAAAATYWKPDAAAFEWVAVGWQRDLDTSFARAAAPSRRVGAQGQTEKAQAPSGFSFFKKDDIKRSQNCGVVGRRVVASLAYTKNMQAEDVVNGMIDALRGLCGRAAAGRGLPAEAAELPASVMELFCNTFEAEGVKDAHAEAMFSRLRQLEPGDLATNMTSYEHLLYKLRVEHEIRDVRVQLQCMRNVGSMCLDAPLHIVQARAILAAFERTQHPRVRSIVWAMREMAAYYIHGNNASLAATYVPDLFEFAECVQRKDDAFSQIFLTYYSPRDTDAEAEAFMADCCRVFEACGSVDWAERNSAISALRGHLLYLRSKRELITNGSDAWTSFYADDMLELEGIMAVVEAFHAEAATMTSDAARSLGVKESAKGEIVTAFGSIFSSLLRSAKDALVKRQKLQEECRVRHCATLARAAQDAPDPEEDFEEWGQSCWLPTVDYVVFIKRLIRKAASYIFLPMPEAPFFRVRHIS